MIRENSYRNESIWKAFCGHLNKDINTNLWNKSSWCAKYCVICNRQSLFVLFFVLRVLWVVRGILLARLLHVLHKVTNCAVQLYIYERKNHKISTIVILMRDVQFCFIYTMSRECFIFSGFCGTPNFRFILNIVLLYYYFCWILHAKTIFFTV